MKPKYHLGKNAIYALEGVKYMLQKERAFQIELLCILPLLVLSFFLEISVFMRIVLDFSLVLILIVESINSAIESCVDLITQDFHPLAKIAKDCASGAVFLSVMWAVILWCYVLGDLYLF
ncbi:diacylglycerol kinase [Helicobacter burdigaliensis]|uniref:diacylglycerol kinase n=1 Tax=Helicobacter burdigaliensis TaxID=2315334 RepID=UPI000EF721EA|nr:diacylglycerol kinase [Helicobacter burdigaliensis]